MRGLLQRFSDTSHAPSDLTPPTPPSQGGEKSAASRPFSPLRRGDAGGFFECLCVAPASAFTRLKIALLSLLLTAAIAPASGSTRVMVQDFEKASAPPNVWVVNIPNENASVQLTTEHPHGGKQCLKLHYKFIGTGQFQYLGIPNKTKILAPIHQLRFMLYGDNSKCSYGVQLTDAGGETHQYSKNTGQGGLIDFHGWKEIVIDLDSGHETWGGDKNGKIDYPITGITFTVGQPTDGAKLMPVESRSLLRFPERQLRAQRGGDPGLPDLRRLARVLLRREGKHPRLARGPWLQERDREMLEARRSRWFRFHRRHPGPRRAGQWFVRVPRRPVPARSHHRQNHGRGRRGQGQLLPAAL